MLVAYGMSIVGTSHVAKNTPCQDSHRYELLENGWMAVAIADGVGSAKHSEIASKIACDTFVETCKDYINKDTRVTELKDIIEKAYKAADQNIKDYVYKIEDIITDYDTTLSVVVYDGNHIVYGHSGDGGIIVLTTSGDYVKVTQPQKAEDGVCVVPLRAGEKFWEFGECEAEVASVLLATDGVYDNFMPYLLRGQPVELYIPLIRWFMDNNVIGITDENRELVEESRKRFLCGDSCKAITDDKTIVVAVNADITPALKDDAYYAEPDWTKLQELWNRKAYPHLYKNKAVVEDKENVSEENYESVASEASDENQTMPLAQTNISSTEDAEEKSIVVTDLEKQTATTTEEHEATETIDLVKTVGVDKGESSAGKKNSLFKLFRRSKD